MEPVIEPVLPDILAPGLRLVFCGSAVGPESFRQKAYYAHPRNRFWATLHQVGLTPRLFEPQDYPKLLDLGIGLTDLAKHAHGVDAVLTATDYDAALLRAKIEQFRPRVLAFTGMKPGRSFMRHCFKRTANECGLQAERIGGTSLFILPSTSPANAGGWDIAPWRDLAEFVRRQ